MRTDFIMPLKTKENGKMDTGTPPILSKEQLNKVVEDFEQYINEKEDPTIVGFCSFYPPIYSDTLGRKWYINKDYISDHNEFSELRKRAIEKQEHYLASGATTNKLNATMSVFRLKQPQHGYTDKTQVESNINMKAKMDLSSMTDEELQDMIKGLSNFK